MRILIAHSFYRLAGGEDRYVEQQVELLGRDHAVELLARRNRDLKGGLSTGATMLYSRHEACSVDEALKRFQPDVVHLHNSYPALGPAVHLASAKLHIPLVMTVHNFRLRCPNGYMFTEGQPCRRCEKGMYANAVAHHCFASRSQAVSYAAGLWAHRFVLRLDRLISLYLCPSEFVATRLMEWGIPSERVEVVRNFTDLPPGSPQPGTFGMYVGRLSSEKGIDVLLRSLKAAGDPPFRVVGDGPLLEDLRKMAASLGLQRTDFLGRQTPQEVAALLERCRYLALPSLWDENAPLAALEAMMAGRPLLVTDTGGLPELVANHEGLKCRRGDSADIAAKIRALMDDDELCSEAGRRAVARAKTEFVPKAHLRHLESAYQKAIAR